MLREVHHFLAQLDHPDHREPNGRTILENALVTISTESGDGRHNDPKRELRGVFHAISSAAGGFKVGEILDLDVGLDIYNTMLARMGVQRRLGPTRRQGREVGAILA